MGMNLKKFELELKKAYDVFEFEVDYRPEQETVVFLANIEAEDYFDDDILLQIFASEKRGITMLLTFDQLDESLEVYRLINEFNNNTVFKGYITKENDNSFFEIEAEVYNLKSHEEGLNFIDFNLINLLSDNTIKYLTPITKITK